MRSRFSVKANESTIAIGDFGVLFNRKQRGQHGCYDLLRQEREHFEGGRHQRNLILQRLCGAKSAGFSNSRSFDQSTALRMELGRYCGATGIRLPKSRMPTWVEKSSK